MRIRGNIHLCYCFNNFRPADDLSENSPLFSVSEKVARLLGIPEDEPFAAGLWANDRNLAFLERPEVLSEFSRILKRRNLYCCTMNIFPFGDFHGTSVKEKVYLPDWRSEERLNYTCRAADFLAKIIPENLTGSLSTLPGAYRKFISSAADSRTVASNIARAAAHLRKTYEKTGRKIVLAFEPEPDCLWQDCADFADFFGSELAADDDCREFVGVCYDCSHHELSGLRPGEGIDICIRNGINIGKIQLSAALGAPGKSAKSGLADFADNVYLHQTSEFNGSGGVKRYRDLPEALEHAQDGSRWKIHYHMPLYLESLPGGLAVEKKDLEAVLAKIRENPAICSILEIETYTFSVLPDEMRKIGVEKSMSQEYRWVLDRLS